MDRICVLFSTVNSSFESCEYFSQIVGGLKRAIDGRKENADPVHIAALDELCALADITQWLKGEP